ncbi:MAG: hypothetical protein Unbinned4139contig1000_7 [Prokaryotic dsDNA virus sp.]|nr:MAG: hypothetical protein Unbinned4139contig1000_7 [Prokaryotic dsDNA virus sp.]|tara:strand:- start:183 stop:371 length:189 start_codon:yes stop_codon:yes gene_type:complete
MTSKTKIILRNDVKVNFGVPKGIYDEFEEIHLIEKRKRNNKLLKKDFIIEVFKKGIREWYNK